MCVFDIIWTVQYANACIYHGLEYGMYIMGEVFVFPAVRPWRWCHGDSFPVFLFVAFPYDCLRECVLGGAPFVDTVPYV